MGSPIPEQKQVEESVKKCRDFVKAFNGLEKRKMGNESSTHVNLLHYLHEFERAHEYGWELTNKIITQVQEKIYQAFKYCDEIEFVRVDDYDFNDKKNKILKTDKKRALIFEKPFENSFLVVAKYFELSKDKKGKLVKSKPYEVFIRITLPNKMENKYPMFEVSYDKYDNLGWRISDFNANVGHNDLLPLITHLIKCFLLDNNYHNVY